GGSASSRRLRLPECVRPEATAAPFSVARDPPPAVSRSAYFADAFIGSRLLIVSHHGFLSLCGIRQKARQQPQPNRRRRAASECASNIDLVQPMPKAAKRFLRQARISIF